MSRVSALYRLQEIDLELDALRARLREIDQSLGESPAVRGAQRRAIEAEARLQTERVNARAFEYDTQALAEKIAEVEQRLYSGVVKNTKELQDLQKDVDSLKRRRQTTDEQQLDALIKAEAAEIELAAVQAELNRIEAEAAKTNRHLVEERAKLKEKVAQLDSKREATLASIPVGDRETYDHLRQIKNGRAVARLEDGVCAACGVAPSSSRSQNARLSLELIRCGNCERILYVD